MRAIRILAVGLVISLAILGARWLLHRDRPTAPLVIRQEALETPPEAGGEPGGPHMLRTGDRIPEARLIDQDGKSFSLSDLEGEVLVVTFLYTHCDLPSMCPLTTARLSGARELVMEENLVGVRFVVVSFDAERDDPDRLKEYAVKYGMDRPDVVFATGSPEELERLSAAFKTFYRATRPGVYDHNIVVSIVDGDGVLQQDFFGTGWTSEELVASVRKVIVASDR